MIIGLDEGCAAVKGQAARPTFPLFYLVMSSALDELEEKLAEKEPDEGDEEEEEESSDDDAEEEGKGKNYYWDGTEYK